MHVFSIGGHDGITGKQTCVCKPVPRTGNLLNGDLYGLMDGFECVDDRFHRVTVMFSKNPIGVVLPAFDGVAKDNCGLLQQHKVTRFLYFCENVRISLHEAR